MKDVKVGETTICSNTIKGNFYKLIEDNSGHSVPVGSIFVSTRDGYIMECKRDESHEYFYANNTRFKRVKKHKITNKYIKL